MLCEIDGIKVNIFRHGQDGAYVYVGASAQDKGYEQMLDGVLVEMMGNVLYTLIVFEVDDWNAQLSPWQARAAFGDEALAGKGVETLVWLTGRCIPALEADGVVSRKAPQYIAGYSLSGLFAIWALMESNVFSGAASCSGSLWMDGWMDYVKEKKLARDARVYLSLGSREARTKNPILAAVDSCTKETYECLKSKQRVKKTVLQWNKGGHFSDTTERLAKGIVWLLNG